MNQVHKKALGVVIPAYGHPGFLAEAIMGACEQVCDQPVLVVVVDDGCRFPETGRVVHDLQLLYPERLFYIRQENTRLPGARNTGIRFLFDIAPDLDAIYFLDADNRIEPYSLQQFRTSLGDDPAVGWAYPDISFFGLSWGENGFETRETAPVYSKLKHLRGNISEAGSLVRGDVFRQGIFFDDSMRSGLEDWDFWLSAMEAGYIGVRTQHSGFIYRRRPESMLAASQREHDGLLNRLYKKHAALYAPRNILSLEQQEAPVFAIYIAGDTAIRLTSDPVLPGTSISLGEFKQLFEASLHEEHAHFFPEFLLLLTPNEAQRLESLSVFLRTCFWGLKAQTADVCRVQIQNGPNDIEAVKDASMLQALLVRQRALKSYVGGHKTDRAKAFNKLHTLYVPLPALLWGGVPVQANQQTEDKASVDLKAALVEFADGLCGQKPWVKHHNRQYSGPDVRALRKLLVDETCAAEGLKAYPVGHTQGRDVFAFSLDKLDQMSIGYLTATMQASHDAGREIACFIEYQQPDAKGKLPLPAAWQEIITDIITFPVSPTVGDNYTYLGATIERKLLLVDQIKAVSVLLRSTDTLYIVGDAACLEVAGELRQYGTKIIVVCPKTESSTSRYLAYEHAIGQLITLGSELYIDLVAAGFPAGKIISECPDDIY
ncbi:glycosyltransferase family A protein [Kordiimonas pumila]|uniref:Glycosyltransferase family A protein n=1 Tax=Kordiimonas pumila TaxID=2161677 RepID=A0ABV7D4P5_9PROT|nr:glycosyltransferase family A protein [Kordiimonas pumila]